MKKFVIASILLAGIAAAAPFAGTAISANADEKTCPPVSAENLSDEEGISPYALTKIAVGTTADSEYVYAHAKNTFTLFSSTVPVQIYLYSSATMELDIANMTLEATNSIADLDMNKEITCSARHTEQRWWCAYAVFKASGKVNTVTSNPVLYSVDGTKLS